MIYAHQLLTSSLGLQGLAVSYLTKFIHLGRLMTTNADYCEDPFDRPHLVRVAFVLLVLTGIF